MIVSQLSMHFGLLILIRQDRSVGRLHIREATAVPAAIQY